MHEIQCPSCAAFIWPDRRKLPGTPDEKGRVGNTIFAFGNFCPACQFRLHDDLSTYDEPHAEFLPQDDEPEEREERPPSKPKKVAPIRKRGDEDLFARIPREYAEAVHEERDLTERLQAAIERREKLEKLMNAIGAPKEPVAAE